jgi:alkanesulfonate monooxygenase SsuD/methylene tetrahydromethanopterin reductase-like flavin-dependent oxidoreductase (luciferase family)
VFGTPEDVAKRLQILRESLGLSGFIMESNVGGRILPEYVLQSIRLVGQEVAPRLRASVD